jgi:hypothetical protein
LPPELKLLLGIISPIADEVECELVASKGYPANGICGLVTVTNQCHNTLIHIYDWCAAAPSKMLVTGMLDGKLEDMEFTFGPKITKTGIDIHFGRECRRGVHLGLHFAENAKIWLLSGRAVKSI